MIPYRDHGSDVSTYEGIGRDMKIPQNLVTSLAVNDTDLVEVDVPQKEGHRPARAKGASRDVTASEDKTVAHIFSYFTEYGVNLGTPDGSPPSGCTDGAEGRGCLGATLYQVPDPGEYSEDGAGVVVARGSMPNGFVTKGIFLVVKSNGGKACMLQGIDVHVRCVQCSLPNGEFKVKYLEGVQAIISNPPSGIILKVVRERRTQ